MGPRSAILSEIRSTLRFSGRATRSEFWWFAPLAILPPVAVASLMQWNKIEIWGIWRLLVVMVVAIPFLSGASRRLQDTGEEGHQAIYPFMPLILLSVGYQMILWIGAAILSVGGVIIAAIWFLALVVLLPLHLIALVASVIAASHILGMMIVPSGPDANRFGPPAVGVAS